MKFLLITDTHYGFSHKTHKKHERFLKEAAKAAVENNVDAVIHTGDWAACSQHQIPRTWKMFREAFGDKPIYTVRGNHDLWDRESFHERYRNKRKYLSKRYVTLQQIYKQQEEWAKEHDIWLLQKHPIEYDDLIIYGFDGWYGKSPVSTDLDFMPKAVESCPIDRWLFNQAYEELSTILEMARFENKKKMLVTHMPPHHESLGGTRKLNEHMNASASWLPFITKEFQVVCFGHTHWHVDLEIDGCRFINSGTDFDQYSRGYDHPAHYIFEI